MHGKRAWAAAALAVAVAFGLGVGAGAAGAIGVRVPTSVGDGMAGEHVATLWAADPSMAYGASGSVAWRDANGSEHEDGWPACLAPGELKGVHFIGATVWHGTSGFGEIHRVGCSAR